MHAGSECTGRDLACVPGLLHRCTLPAQPKPTCKGTLYAGCALQADLKGKTDELVQAYANSPEKRQADADITEQLQKDSRHSEHCWLKHRLALVWNVL